MSACALQPSLPSHVPSTCFAPTALRLACIGNAHGLPFGHVSATDNVHCPRDNVRARTAPLS
eukprot:1325204-Rhodomonas_salina.1